MTTIKAIVSACGLKAKPINPYDVPNRDAFPHYRDFERIYPELFLTSPQVSSSEIMVEAVYQYCDTMQRFETWHDCEIDYDNYIIPKGCKRRKVYQPIQITKKAEHEINLNKTNNMSMIDPDDRKKFGSSPTEQKKPSENEMAGYSDAERIKAYMIVYEMANTLNARNFIQWCDKEDWFFMQPIKTPKLKP